MIFLRAHRVSSFLSQPDQEAFPFVMGKYIKTENLVSLRFPSYTQALTLHIRFFHLSFFFLVYCTLSPVYLLFTLYLTTHILTICNITMKRTRLCLTVILKLGLCGPRNSVKCELLKTSFLDNLCYVARCFSNSCLAPARII